MTTVVCDAACTITLQHEIVTPVFNLDTADGAAIAGAILLVWAAGFAFRMLIRALNVDRPGSTSEASE